MDKTYFYTIILLLLTPALKNIGYFSSSFQLPMFSVSESSDIIALVCVCCQSLDPKLGALH